MEFDTLRVLILMLKICTAFSAKVNADPINFCEDFILPNCTWRGPAFFNINASSPCRFSCTHDLTSGKAVRIGAQLRTNPLISSIFISALQAHTISSWTLPKLFPAQGENQPFSAMSEILCPARDVKQERIGIRVETSVESNVTLNFTIQLVAYKIQLGEVVRVKSTPVSPWFKWYEWDSGSDSVLVSAESVGSEGHSVCAYLSLQDAKCPVGDTASGIIAARGKYTSFDEKATLIAEKSQFPNGLLILVLPLPEDNLCTGRNQVVVNKTSRWKTTQIQISRHGTIQEYWLTYFLTTLVLGIFSTSVVTAVNFFMQRYHSKLQSENGYLASRITSEENSTTSTLSDAELSSQRGENEAQPSIEYPPPAQAEGQSGSNIDKGNLRFPDNTEYSNIRLEISDAILEDNEGDIVEENTPRQNVILAECRSNVLVFPPINRSLNPRYLEWWKQLKVYEQQMSNALVSEIGFYNTLLISALFVSLPFIDILKDYLTDLLYKGWEDKCHFNLRCAVSLWFFSDFSAIYTNLFYIIHGLAFFFILHRHRRLLPQCEDRAKFGVNRNYGLLCCLGIGLIVQGIMSSLYHTCPNKVTLRFDLMFMYVITIILVVTVWGLRHSSVQHHVYSVVCLVGILLIVAELQEWMNPNGFWAIFSLIHFCLTISTSYTLYAFNNWSISPCAVYMIYKEWSKISKNISDVYIEENSTGIKLKKVTKFAAGVSLNIILMAVGWARNTKAATYLLMTFLANGSSYILHYIVSKIWHKESVNGLACVSLAFSSASWIAALCFYFRRINDSEGTPAMSKLYNADCILFGLFDAHDIWHILSAYGLFFSFVGILLMDENLARTNVKKIRSF